MSNAQTNNCVASARPLILCVEDDLSCLTLRNAVLEHEGYGVIGVTTAGDALKVLRESLVTIVIADHMLEGTTGVKLAKEMKQIKPEVPIILISGDVPEDLGCIDVSVGKGQPTEKLLGIVREVVQRACS